MITIMMIIIIIIIIILINNNNHNAVLAKRRQVRAMQVNSLRQAHLSMHAPQVLCTQDNLVRHMQSEPATAGKFVLG